MVGDSNAAAKCLEKPATRGEPRKPVHDSAVSKQSEEGSQIGLGDPGPRGRARPGRENAPPIGRWRTHAQSPCPPPSWHLPRFAARRRKPTSQELVLRRREHGWLGRGTAGGFPSPTPPASSSPLGEAWEAITRAIASRQARGNSCAESRASPRLVKHETTRQRRRPAPTCDVSGTPLPGAPGTTYAMA